MSVCVYRLVNLSMFPVPKLTAAMIHQVCIQGKGFL